MPLLLLLSISDHLSRSTRSVTLPMTLPLCMLCLVGAADVMKFVCKVHAHAVEHDRAAASIVA
jgi:hypothetical protein